MSIFLLIRHGNNPAIGGRRIPGRMPGIRLNAEGKAQAEHLTERLAGVRIDAVYSSPMERTLETAAPLARRLGLPIETSEEFTEVDVGDWSGMDLDQLTREPLWKAYNHFRSGTRPPGGEILIEVQQRMVSGLDRLRRKHPEQTVAVFSHADPIKAALAYYAAIPADCMTRLEIGLVSISTVSISDNGVKILGINCTGNAV
ncbi:MAG: histidine phosphatase family protein [Syntrophobacteraceae bacterium]